MFLVFICMILTQLLFGFIYWYKAGSTLSETASLPQVSVLVCGKNEADNFQKHLVSILEQDYPTGDFEVLVVNDGSTDESLQILEALQKTYPQLRILDIPAAEPKRFPGKKNALHKGLQQCAYPLVLLSDADCRPAGPNWIRIMAGTYAQAKALDSSPHYFVFGYGAYRQQPGLLNRFIRWETVHTFQQYSSWARMGLPYMGVGRNMLYERDQVLHTLDKDPAFAQTFSQTPSGDDDLIVAYLAQKENTLIVTDPDARTISEVPASWKAWWKQKTRHVSSGKYYPEKVKTGLALYAFSSFLSWIIALAILIGAYSHQIKIIVLLLMLCRIGLYTLNAGKWYKGLGEKKLLLFYPLGDLMWVGYNMVLSPFIFWKNKQQWK